MTSKEIHPLWWFGLGVMGLLLLSATVLGIFGQPDLASFIFKGVGTLIGGAALVSLGRLSKPDR